MSREKQRALCRCKVNPKAHIPEWEVLTVRSFIFIRCVQLVLESALPEET